MNTVIIQLERAATDLSETLIIQWITWIQLFNFKVKHVFRNRHTAVNKLSRQLKVEKKMNNMKNIDKFINFKLNVVKVLILEAEKKVDILKSEYSHEN